MQSTRQEYSRVDDWLTINAFIEKHPQFHMGQLRWLLRHREENGLNKAVRKIGRNIYINEPLFSAWIVGEEQEPYKQNTQTQ